METDGEGVEQVVTESEVVDSGSRGEQVITQSGVADSGSRGEQITTRSGVIDGGPRQEPTPAHEQERPNIAVLVGKA